MKYGEMTPDQRREAAAKAAAQLQAELAQPAVQAAIASVMSDEPAGTVQDCGHVAEPGRAARAVGNGRTMCYACADKAERDLMARADAYTGYVSASTPGEFTTWPGGRLAMVTSLTVSRRRYTPTGGMYRMRYVRATAPDGSTWHGAGSDEWDLITLRRDKDSMSAPRCYACGLYARTSDTAMVPLAGGTAHVCDQCRADGA